MLRYYARFIPRLGHEVVSLAEDGQKLLEDCQRSTPDLVITDLSMPRLDGLAVMCQIDTPFIMVSAHPKPEGTNPLLESRCIGWLVKPINQRDLMQVLTDALDRLDRKSAAASDSGRAFDFPASTETDDDSADDGRNFV